MAAYDWLAASGRCMASRGRTVMLVTQVRTAWYSTGAFTSNFRITEPLTMAKRRQTMQRAAQKRKAEQKARAEKRAAKSKAKAAAAPTKAKATAAPKKAKAAKTKPEG